MIIKTYNGKLLYRSPQTKVVCAKAGNVLCQSTETERFTLGSTSYDEDDWE